jgi:acetolactate synthase I/II/III large subunit
MGFGLPTAIGAALACPERTVICFSGDGSLLMNIQELATAVEEDLNIKIVVMNNRSLGLVHQQQDLFFGKRYFASKFRADLDFAKIAAGFGMPAYDLAGTSEPIAMLNEAIARPGPCLIHARIDVREFVFPIVPPGAANRDMLGGKTNVNTCI